MSKQRMCLKLTQKPQQLNCGDYSSCHECLEMNMGQILCPPYKVKNKPLTKIFFTQKHTEPDDIYFS
jgi:hypothetical protein